MTRQDRNKNLALRMVLLNILVLAGLCIPAWGDSAEEMERRLAVGLELFPNILSIDLDLADKRLPDGSLLLLVVYTESNRRTDMFVEKLSRSVKTIHQFPVAIRSLHHGFDALPAGQVPCGVLLLDPVPEPSFRRMLKLAVENRFILFSPHEPDIRRGVTVGLRVTSRIKPVLNMKTLNRSTIHLHKEFIRLSDHYE